MQSYSQTSFPARADFVYCALQMLILNVGRLQIRPSGYWMRTGVVVQTFVIDTLHRLPCAVGRQHRARHDVASWFVLSSDGSYG